MTTTTFGPASPLGRTLVIANPAAHSGKGAQGAEFAEHFLGSYAAATNGYDVRLTRAAGDAEHMARAAAAEGFDTVIALGGDGVIHEVANGLMSLPGPAAARPALGIVPLGSGNDYARTLGMVIGDVQAAFAQLVRGELRTLDMGRVNGVHFMETLSFGLDAAIALDTTARRAAGTAQEGSGLFVTSGLKILSGPKRGWPCRVRFNDEDEVLELRELIFAVQVGPTYGGGFRICPEADPTDGLLDVCYNVKKPLLPHLLTLFLRARSGGHAKSPVVRFTQVKRIDVEFEREPPAQVDGERIVGTRFRIDSEPAALRVVMPST